MLNASSKQNKKISLNVCREPYIHCDQYEIVSFITCETYLSLSNTMLNVIDITATDAGVNDSKTIENVERNKITLPYY